MVGGSTCYSRASDVTEQMQIRQQVDCGIAAQRCIAAVKVYASSTSSESKDSELGGSGAATRRGYLNSSLLDNFKYA